MINNKLQISGLVKIGSFLQDFLQKDQSEYNSIEKDFQILLKKTELENPWFTIENQRYAFQNWANLLDQKKIEDWLISYRITKIPKQIGLILAGNIPMVGFHDVICVVLSGNIPIIKPSSKDKHVIPFILSLWNEFSEGNVKYQFVEKLVNYDAIIATGSNNTAEYLEQYFKNTPRIIRKNRTSVGILKGNETDEQLQNLAEDIFRYFGMGCRNITQLFLPKTMSLNRLFENFMAFSGIINHHSYANNYDYHKAIYLLNQEIFWDNNFVMMKESESLFSPLSVIYFSRYNSLDNIIHFLENNEDKIQCIVANPELEIQGSIDFGMAQKPFLTTYADQIDTIRFLEFL